MNLSIKPLTPEFADDYFDFFENRAFTDDSPYRCYCQMYQMTKDEAKLAFDNLKGVDPGYASRKVAEKQIATGALQGYLAYADGVSIGWCNANDKASYPIESCNFTQFYKPIEKCVKAVVCFEVAPEYRGKGVATALLQRVIDDAKVMSYIAVEGYPVVRSEYFKWDCTGPVRLYEKFGFIKVAKQDSRIVMRKEL